MKKSAFAKFDETVEVAVRLGVDPRHADQVVRGTVVLPAGTGKSVRVLVIAVGDKAREAEAAGADFVGAEYIAEDQGRLARLRRPDRHAGPDGSARPARSRARSARTDAEPEGRHGDVQRRPARCARRRPARSSSASTRAATSTRRSARSRSRVDALETNFTAFMDQIVRSKPAAAKGVYVTQRLGLQHDGPRRRRSTPLPTGNER